MDEAGNRTTSGAPVELITCSNDNEQNWTVNPDGTIEVNGLCLSTRHGATASGTPVVASTCNGSTGQQWQQGTGNTLINQAAGTCLTDPGVQHHQRHPAPDCQLHRKQRPELAAARRPGAAAAAPGLPALLAAA